MATKGIQANGALQVNLQRAEEGQALRRAARHAKKNHVKAVAPVATTKNSEEASLRALFSATRKAIADNHVSRDPALILRHSKEMRKAHAFHGHEERLRRVYNACIKSGVSEEAAAKFATKACAQW